VGNSWAGHGVGPPLAVHADVYIEQDSENPLTAI